MLAQDASQKMLHVSFPLQSHHFYPLCIHEGVEVNQLIGNLMREEDETFTATSKAASVVVNTVSVVQTKPYLKSLKRRSLLVENIKLMIPSLLYWLL